MCFVQMRNWWVQVGQDDNFVMWPELKIMQSRTMCCTRLRLTRPWYGFNFGVQRNRLGGQRLILAKSF